MSYAKNLFYVLCHLIQVNDSRIEDSIEIDGNRWTLLARWFSIIWCLVIIVVFKQKKADNGKASLEKRNLLRGNIIREKEYFKREEIFREEIFQADKNIP